ncbi:MAG: hypothetical protein WCR27_09780, partial [Eubacteriales bacterium]
MEVKWKDIFSNNKNLFIVSDWEECNEDKKQAWHLPTKYDYFSAGDMNLRVGIVASGDVYREEEFLLAGVLWGSRLGNGARTVVYFVASDFSSVFLRALAELGGKLTGKAIYWREKLTPSL